MWWIPSIGVNMHVEGTEEWEDEQADILSGKCIDVDFLNYTPDLRDTPKVQDAIKKLIAAYPEKDVIDMQTKEQKIQTLAAELDQLSYDIDTFEYRDSVPDREAQVQMIANDIRCGNVKPLQIYIAKLPVCTVITTMGVMEKIFPDKKDNIWESRMYMGVDLFDVPFIENI